MSHREDDIHDEGYCPKCGRTLADLSIGGSGFCEEHGWVYADWTRPKEREDEDE